MAGDPVCSIAVRCHAKINLTLDLVGRRADGYHHVRTVMQAIGLADTLEATPAAELSFTCSDPVLSTPDNLVYRAARLLQSACAVRAGASLRLVKRIPVAAGLGGGSSDAAGTIIALNRLWDLRLSLAEQQRLAAQLGSDVPFFLTGGTALAVGRGERVTPLPPLPTHWVVLVLPPITLSTAAVYASVMPSDYTSGVVTANTVAAAQRGTLSPQAQWHNALARPARGLAPEITAAEAALLQSGATFAHVSGSGPTVFAVCGDSRNAQTLADRLRQRGRTLIHAPFVQAGWAWDAAGE